MKVLKKLNYYLYFDKDKFLNLLDVCERFGKINEFFQETANFNEDDKRIIIHLFIKNYKYRCYLEFFKDTRVQNPFRLYLDDVNPLINSIKLINYEITDEFGFVRLIRTLFQRKKINEVKRIIEETTLNPITLFKICNICLERNYRDLAELCLDSIEDWKLFNEEICFHANNPILTFVKENDLDLIKKIYDKIDWSNSNVFCDYKYCQEDFNADTIEFFTQENKKIQEFLKEQFGYSEEIKNYPRFNLNDFNKTNKKIVQESLKNKVKMDYVVIFLNYCTAIKKALPDLDDQLLIPYFKEFPKLCEENSLIFYRVFPKDFHLIRELYDDRRIIKMIFRKEYRLTDLITLIDSHKDLIKLQVPKNDYCIKKPKSFKEVSKFLSLVLNKQKQQNFRLEQPALEFLNGTTIGDFLIKLPKDAHELINIGLNLNICVGNSFYAKKVLNKESNILILYNLTGSIILGVLELKNGEVLQCRSENNQNIDFRIPKEIKDKLKST